MLLMKVPVGRVGVPESHPTTARHGLGDGGGGGGGDVGGVGGGGVPGSHAFPPPGKSLQVFPSSQPFPAQQGCPIQPQGKQ